MPDNGIGIEEEYLDHIFEPLKRLHSHSEHPETGLDLATCTKVLERLGGRIDVTSKSGTGTGTTFAVTLPLAPTDGSQALSGSNLGDTSHRQVTSINRHFNTGDVRGLI
ncbi:MAG: light-regulated signal transduction histidine kinase (bacteriophytochrome) [Gammaproteobacteria bacterium]